MKKALTIFLLFIIFNGPVMAQDKMDGWGKAKWGMNIDEVSGAYEGKLRQGVEKDKYIEFILSDPVRIADVDFEANFRFNKTYKKLFEVWVKAPKNKEPHYDTIFNLLVAKYGPVYSERKDKLTGSALWTKDDTRIELQCLFGGGGFLGILYSPKGAGTGNL